MLPMEKDLVRVDTGPLIVGLGFGSTFHFHSWVNNNLFLTWCILCFGTLFCKEYFIFQSTTQHALTVKKKLKKIKDRSKPPTDIYMVCPTDYLCISRSVSWGVTEAKMNLYFFSPFPGCWFLQAKWASWPSLSLHVLLRPAVFNKPRCSTSPAQYDKP